MHRRQRQRHGRRRGVRRSCTRSTSRSHQRLRVPRHGRGRLRLRRALRASAPTKCCAAPTSRCTRPRARRRARAGRPTTRPWRPARSRRSRSRRRFAGPSRTGELQVFYQPIVRASDLAIVGARGAGALAVEGARLGRPALFIPVAEETGLIHDIGRYVFEQACARPALWPGISMAINVSPVQLRDPNFADDVRRHRPTLRAHAPTCFELELTEGILVKQSRHRQAQARPAEGVGFKLSLDDFGTGFSSIGYLRQFPFDKLKVDRSLRARHRR